MGEVRGIVTLKWGENGLECKGKCRESYDLRNYLTNLSKICFTYKNRPICFKIISYNKTNMQIILCTKH